MDERRVGALFVVESGRLVGVISIGDLVRAVIDQQARAVDQLNAFIGGPYPGWAA